MIARLVILSFVLFFLSACNNKNSVPGTILPPKKMQNLLWDMMRADQFVSDYIIKQDTTRNRMKESLVYYQQIFAIHKVTKEEFEKSFDWYKDHPEHFKAVMDSISQSANQVTTEMIKPLAAPDTTRSQ